MHFQVVIGWDFQDHFEFHITITFSIEY